MLGHSVCTFLRLLKNLVKLKKNLVKLPSGNLYTFLLTHAMYESIPNTSNPTPFY